MPSSPQPEEPLTANSTATAASSKRDRSPEPGQHGAKRVKDANGDKKMSDGDVNMADA
jgi:hypothetical protein